MSSNYISKTISNPTLAHNLQPGPCEHIWTGRSRAMDETQAETRAKTTAETRAYASQTTYKDVGLERTSIAVFCGLSCVLHMVEPMCSQAQMRLLVQTAAATHAAISATHAQGGSTTLQQHEVLQNIDKPCSVLAEELYGYTTPRLPELAAFVHVSELFALLRPGEALVLTGGGHTTALFRTAAGLLHCLDSMPARVAAVASAEALVALLKASHKGMQEFTATRLVLRQPLVAHGD